MVSPTHPQLRLVGLAAARTVPLRSDVLSRPLVAFICGLLLCASPSSSRTGAAEKGETVADASTPVSFCKDLAPILARKCLKCHGPEKTKGGYQLHTFELALKAGESKEPSIVPGEPGRSELFRRLAAKDEDDRMPQKDDPLPSDQISLFERWIKAGAPFDGPDPKAALNTLVPRGPHPEPPAAYPRAVPILALAFSPNGQELAVGGYHEITIWNPADGQLLRRIKNVAQRIHDLAFSPDGSLLAAAGGAPGQDGEVTLLDPANASPIRVLGTAPDSLLAVCFSPDGKRLAVGGTDNAIRLYDVADGKERWAVQQHADWVMALAFNQDGSHLASASRDRTARLYNAQTGELELTFNDHNAPVFAVAFSAQFDFHVEPLAIAMNT